MVSIKDVPNFKNLKNVLSNFVDEWIKKKLKHCQIKMERKCCLFHFWCVLNKYIFGPSYVVSALVFITLHTSISVYRSKYPFNLTELVEPWTLEGPPYFWIVRPHWLIVTYFIIGLQSYLTDLNSSYFWTVVLAP